jgi:hypothetical protein
VQLFGDPDRHGTTHGPVVRRHERRVAVRRRSTIAQHDGNALLDRANDSRINGFGRRPNDQNVNIALKQILAVVTCLVGLSLASVMITCLIRSLCCSAACCRACRYPTAQMFEIEALENPIV